MEVPTSGSRVASRRGINIQLRRGHATGLPADDLLKQAVPRDTWISWQQAREYVAGSLVGDIWSAGGFLDETWGLPVWAQYRAEALLADAVRRGVLNVQDVLAPRRPGGRIASLLALAVALGRDGRATATRLCAGPLSSAPVCA